MEALVSLDKEAWCKTEKLGSVKILVSLLHTENAYE